MKLSRHAILMYSLDFAFQNEGWNPPLRRALEGLSAEQADWRPEIGGAQAIREIVTHLLL